MYESPIEKIYGNIQDQIIKQDEEHLMYSVNQAVGYLVDKDELLKALQYDRDQYQKGFSDGQSTLRSHICKCCKYYEQDFWGIVDGVPMIIGHHLCNKWGNGCVTNPNGFCHFWGEKQEDENE